MLSMGIGNMSAIPSKQKINSSNRRYGYMQGIQGSIWWNCLSKQLASQYFCLIVEFEFCYSFYSSKSFGTRDWITRSNLLYNQIRDVEFVNWSLFLPPTSGQFLQVIHIRIFGFSSR